MGIVHSATTVDTGYSSSTSRTRCRRTKNDDISRMCAELSRKRGGSGNRRIRQNGKSGRQGKRSKGAAGQNQGATRSSKGGSGRGGKRSSTARRTGSHASKHGGY